MRDRRRVAIATSLAILLVTSGCVGFIAGDEPLTFEATEGSVAASTLGETGYEHNRTNAFTVNRTFEAAGQSREVTVTNHLAEYQKSVDLGVLGGERKAAVFVVFTTPKVQVLGKTFNPVGDMSNRELLSRLQSSTPPSRSARSPAATP